MDFLLLLKAFHFARNSVSQDLGDPCIRKQGCVLILYFLVSRHLNFAELDALEGHKLSLDNCNSALMIFSLSEYICILIISTISTLSIYTERHSPCSKESA